MAFKTFEYDADCLSNSMTNVAEPSVVNNIQEKLLRMESDYAKRMKIQEICYKKKLSDVQKNMDFSHKIDVSHYIHLKERLAPPKQKSAIKAKKKCFKIKTVFLETHNSRRPSGENGR